MKTLNMQQLCSYVRDDQKIDDSFIILKVNDISIFEKFKIIGCRLNLLVFSGSIEADINGKTSSLHRCDFVDILEGTSFGFRSFSKDVEFYCFVTTREFMIEVMQNIVPGPKDYFSIIINNPVIHMSTNSTSRLYRQMRLVDDILSDLDHNYRKEMLKVYFRGYVLELGDLMIKEDRFQMQERGTVRMKDALMANFMELVWKNFRERREVSFYAKELCVSSKHLSRVVKTWTGKTPHEIISEEVLGLSVQLLKNNGILIQQISDLLHFADQAAFSKFFRKNMKMSPSEYRRKSNGFVPESSPVDEK